jgi:hypothetical protein
MRSPDDAERGGVDGRDGGKVEHDHGRAVVLERAGQFPDLGVDVDVEAARTSMTAMRPSRWQVIPAGSPRDSFFLTFLSSFPLLSQRVAPLDAGDDGAGFAALVGPAEEGDELGDGPAGEPLGGNVFDGPMLTTCSR